MWFTMLDTIRAYKDWWYMHCLHTDHEGFFIGEDESGKLEFIFSEGAEPSIKRFATKKQAKKWMQSKVFWPARDPHVVKMMTVEGQKKLQETRAKMASRLFVME